MFRTNQNDLNYSPQEVGFGSGGYAGGAPVIAPTFVSAPTQPFPNYAFAPPVAPIAPVLPGTYGCGGQGFLGGLSPIGLVGINDLFNRDRGRDHDCKDNDGDLAILAAVAGAKEASVNEGRGILAAVAASNSTTVAEARALFASICDAEKTNLQQFNALAIQNSNNTQSIKDQATAQHAAILAAINDDRVERLRDELHTERRHRDLDVIRIENNNTNTNVQAQFQAQAQAQLQRDLDEHRRKWDLRENEINITNTNTNINAQAQAQAQAQAIREVDRDHRWNARFDALLAQSNKSNQDIVNLGTMVASGTQTPTQTNVNTKSDQ